MNKTLKTVAKFFLILSLVLVAQVVLFHNGNMDSMPPNRDDMILSAPIPDPTDSHDLHWAKPFAPDDIRLRVLVTATSQDTVSKLWLKDTPQIFRAWEVYAPMFSFSQTRVGATTPADIEVAIANYGATGWISQSEVSRDANYHITHGVIKLNAFYVADNWDTLNEYSQGIYCHEFGHILGLHDNRTGILDGTPDTTCMHEQGLLIGTGSNTPYISDTAYLNDLYAHAEPTIPSYDYTWDVVVDSFPAP